jgi:hypothetical protein
MSNKFNNKYLLIVLVVLGALLLFLKFYKSPKMEKTLRTNIVQVDTAKVTRVVIYPSSPAGDRYIFNRSASGWSISNGTVEARTGRNTIPNLLNEIVQIKPIRLESRMKETWSDYNLTDSAATRIEVFEGEKQKLDLYIGKFTYQQTNDPYSGRGGVKGTSYVRLASEDDVYAVDGFLTFTFNQPFSSWRNQTFVKLRKSDVTRLTFSYPADSSFVISQENNRWMLGNQLADSAKVDSYLGSISNKTASSFDDSFEAVGNPLYRLTIEGNNMEPVTVNAFVKDGNELIMNSVQNPEAWFTTDRNGLFKDIYKGMEYFR